MGNLLKVVQEAPKHHTFTSEAFTSQIGKVVPLDVAGRTYNSTVVSAEVSEDGSSATVTFEVPDGLFSMPPMSIGED